MAAALLVAGAVASGQPSQVRGNAAPSHPLGVDQLLTPPPYHAVRPAEPLPAGPQGTGPGLGSAPTAQPIAVSTHTPTGPASVAATDLPATALDAYTNAAAVMAKHNPACGLSWSILAGIGQVESNHGRFGGAALGADGYPSKPIRGIALDGRPGVALIPAIDGGRWTGDPVFDRAVGPMQFLTSTWRSVAADGNGDGRADPNNIYDAALGAANYLCAGGGDLRTDPGARAAVFRYNHAESYVTMVLTLARDYEHGVAPTVPENPVGDVSAPADVADLPPASVTDVDQQPPAAAPAQPAASQAQPAAEHDTRPVPADRPALAAPVVGAAEASAAAAPSAPAAGGLTAEGIDDVVHDAICAMAATMPGPVDQAVDAATAAVLRQHGVRRAKPVTGVTCHPAGHSAPPQGHASAAPPRQQPEASPTTTR
ncbi:lytic transglycosylase domain-containing protein [Solihabitans fulvus]|uniref:lytic transglycosylase domain-containing protein n=1 Tax=Solihabitans fulvus TaxID=1892852 RepID=UPI001CB7606A|nr:lytic transglycosylase domain-containing protein [Solihabitans fulvus]